MKNTLCRNLVWTAALVASVTSHAAELDPNRVSFSARAGFNISGKFKGIGSGLVPAPNARRTPSQPGRPNGDLYNYEDGYVLERSQGSLGEPTWYWGYDDSASQVSGNTVLLSRSIANSAVSGDEQSAEVSPGGELVYNRHLGERGRMRYGFEFAVNYQNIRFSDHSAYTANLTRATDAYPFEPGTTPPEATPANPYQGSFVGPGFLLDSIPVGSPVISVIPMVITGNHRFEAHLWGCRLGPYVEFPVTERLDVSLSAGFTLAWLVAEASWSERGALPSGGIVATSGKDKFSDFDTLWGGLAQAEAAYDLGKNWTLLGGVQLQSLGDYEHNFAGRKVELDLRSSIFVTVGLGKSF